MLQLNDFCYAEFLAYSTLENKSSKTYEYEPHELEYNLEQLWRVFKTHMVKLKMMKHQNTQNKQSFCNSQLFDRNVSGW